MARLEYSGSAVAPGTIGGDHSPHAIALPAGFAATTASTRAGFLSRGQVDSVTASSMTVVAFPGRTYYWMVTGDTP